MSYENLSHVSNKGGNFHDTHLQFLSGLLIDSISNNKKKVACCHKLVITYPIERKSLLA